MDWQPIGTAPFYVSEATGATLCPPVLIYAVYPSNPFTSGVVGVAYNDGKQWVWDGAYCIVEPRWTPTHWRARPSPPSDSTQ